jgi:DNA primase
MVKIPEHIIDQVREANDIVSVISSYISLKKQGKNYIALCPFHTEKTPSFSVSPEKQIFYCFGCGIGGNVFSFLMSYEKISFLEAIQKLAADAGISLPKYKEDEKQVSEYEKLYRVNQFACKFYVETLTNHISSLKTYFKERNIKEESLKLFQIGYIHESWDSLYQEILKQKMDPMIFLTAGLLLKSDRDPNRIYDRFRNRLIFPIQNVSGRVIAFGGRTLSDEEDVPKYINSPESPIYYKSQTLYGLNYSKDWIRKEDASIIVEGYMDFLQLFQHNIKNVVATSGTALTIDHAKLLRRYSQNCILCYDSDTAGVNAALRGGQIIFQENLEVKVLLLPEGEDPDSFVKKNGASSFFALLKTAKDYFDFKVERLTHTYGGDSISQQTRIVSELIDSLVTHKDALKRNFYINLIAQKYGLQENTLLSELNKKRKIISSRESIRIDEPEKEKHPKYTSITLTGAWNAEKDVLNILINHLSEVKRFIFEILEEDDFLNQVFKDVFKLIKRNQDKSSEELIHLIISKTPDQQIVGMLSADLFSEIQDPERYLNDCIQKIKITKYQTEIDKLRKQLSQLNPEEIQYTRILEQINKNLIQIKELRKIFAPHKRTT